MLRIIIKIALFPVVVMLTVFEKVCDIAVNLSGLVFRVIAGVFILTALLSYGFGLEPWSAAVRMIVEGVILLAIPFIAMILTTAVSFLNMLLRTI